MFERQRLIAGIHDLSIKLLLTGRIQSEELLNECVSLSEDILGVEPVSWCQSDVIRQHKIGTKCFIRLQIRCQLTNKTERLAVPDPVFPRLFVLLFISSLFRDSSGTNQHVDPIQQLEIRVTDTKH